MVEQSGMERTWFTSSKCNIPKQKSNEKLNEIDHSFTKS